MEKEELSEQLDVRLDGLLVERERSAEGRIVDEGAGAGGEQPQQQLEFGWIAANAADLRQVAREGRLDIRPKVARTLARVAVQRIWESAGDDELGARGATLGRTAHAWRCAVEQRVDDRPAFAFDLGPRERPEVQILDPARERVGNDAGGEQVGRPREQELARRGIVVEDLLDREHQARHALNLIDHRRTRQRKREPVGIGPGGVARRLVVECEVVGDDACGLKLPGKRALPGLAGSGDRRGPAHRQDVPQLRLDGSRDQRHTASLQHHPDQSGVS